VVAFAGKHVAKSLSISTQADDTRFIVQGSSCKIPVRETHGAKTFWMSCDLSSCRLLRRALIQCQCEHFHAIRAGKPDISGLFCRTNPSDDSMNSQKLSWLIFQFNSVKAFRNIENAHYIPDMTRDIPMAGMYRVATSTLQYHRICLLKATPANPSNNPKAIRFIDIAMPVSSDIPSNG